MHVFVKTKVGKSSFVVMMLHPGENKSIHVVLQVIFTQFEHFPLATQMCIFNNTPPVSQCSSLIQYTAILNMDSCAAYLITLLLNTN